MTRIKPHALYRYGTEPKCPRCGYVGFDDWWHVLNVRKGLPKGRLTCGSCEKLFYISGVPGNITSSAFGLDTTDLMLRSVGY